jgi:Collagen triple helix repeat (20 copies)
MTQPFRTLNTFVLTEEWQSTALVVGSYFKVSHLQRPLQNGVPVESIAAIAQVDPNGVVFTQKNFRYQVEDTRFILDQPPELELRRLAFKLLPNQTPWTIKVEILDIDEETVVAPGQSIPGIKGDKGDKGDPGNDGAPGAQGLKGDKGDKGDTGAAGAQGLKGDKGDTGAPGAQGLKGDKGDTGAAGAAGADGRPGTAYRSGSDVTLAMSQAASVTTAQFANTLRAFPWRVHKPITLTQLRAEVSTLLASSSFRLGLYEDNGSGYPGALVAGSDVSAFDSSTAGVKPNIFAAPITLAAGLYWVAINNSGTPTLRGISVAAIDPVLGFNPAGGTSCNYTCLSIAQAYGAMPNAFPAGATPAANVSAPLAMFRVR